MSLLAASTWQRSVPAILAAVLLSGCTMCPDPFDYSGPVPNGSPAQNDFRARSNGILPLSAAPVPWPPLVDADGKSGVHRAGGPRPDAANEKVARVGFTGGAQPDAQAAQPDDSPAEPAPPLGDEGDAAAPTAPSDEIARDLEPTRVEVNGESPPQTAVEPAAAAPLAETPGWRARR